MISHSFPKSGKFIEQARMINAALGQQNYGGHLGFNEPTFAFKRLVEHNLQ